LTLFFKLLIMSYLGARPARKPLGDSNLCEQKILKLFSENPLTSKTKASIFETQPTNQTKP